MDGENRGLAKQLSTIYLSLAVLHSAYIVFFFMKDCIFLGVYNLLASILYIAMTIMVRRTHKYFLFLNITLVEIFLFSTLSTIMISGETGFTYFFWAVIPMVYYLEHVAQNYNTKRNLTYLLIIICMFFVSKGISFSGKYIRYVFNIRTEHVLFFVNAFLSVFVLIHTMVNFEKRIRDERSEMVQENKAIEDSANIDPLTQLLNRRSLDEHITKFFKNALGEGKDFTLLMCDLDNFKRINDEYGHDCGDEVLKGVSAAIKGALRDGDEVFRWGGEEILILVSTGWYATKTVAERCRKAVEDMEINYKGNKVKITITIGGCSYFQGVTRDVLIERADANLYKGKTNGKNQVVM